MKKWLVCLSMGLLVMSAEVQAKRMGGGSSFGKQSSRVTQMQKAPTAPTQAGTTAAKPAAAAPATPAKRPWAGMLGGLAAGLGLAWLASSLGLGAEMGQFLLLLLVGFGLFMLLGWFKRSRQAAQSPAYAYAGGADQAATPTTYKPEKVGNDASARPWELNNAAFEASAPVASGGSIIGSGLGGVQMWGVPVDFDTENFLKAAKNNFVSLQAAWDRADMAALRAMMTDDMLKEIQAQLAERDAHTGVPANLTEVVMIEARLLGIEDLGDDYLASVEFSGMIREEPASSPSPFREVWNMSKSKAAGSGWLVAGVQALQ
jgi:predicted lipid-binding transport protein (Tim44 family)